MSDMTLQQTEISKASAVVRSNVIKDFRKSDNFFRYLSLSMALFVLVILGGVIFSLVEGSIPAFRVFGFGFFTTESWNPVTEKFGAAAPIYGTLVTSIIAMLIAVPVGIGIAIFLTELCPLWLRRPIEL